LAGAMTPCTSVGIPADASAAKGASDLES
jgi:hypothetical protein